MSRPDIDTIETFFLVAFENSTTMSKMGIDSVLGLIEWAKAQEASVVGLNRELSKARRRVDILEGFFEAELDQIEEVSNES